MSFAEPGFVAELFFRSGAAAVAGLEKGRAALVNFVVGILCQLVVSVLVQGTVGTGYCEHTYCAGAMDVASMGSGDANAAVVGTAYSGGVCLCLAGNALVVEQRFFAALDC